MSFHMAMALAVDSNLLQDFLASMMPIATGKSEYVLSLEFSCEDTLYVATNNGYIYPIILAKGVKSTELVQVSEKVPIIFMGLLSRNLAGNDCSVDDWLSLGDGKGKMTIVRIIGDVCTPEMDFTCTWPSEKERNFYWCKACGYSSRKDAPHRMSRSTHSRSSYRLH